MPVTIAPDTPQQRAFDTKYITIGEIRERLNIVASTIMLARQSGRFPNAIACNGGYVWERDAVMPHLLQYVRERQVRKEKAEARRSKRATLV